MEIILIVIKSFFKDLLPVIALPLLVLYMIIGLIIAIPRVEDNARPIKYQGEYLLAPAIYPSYYILKWCIEPVKGSN